MWPHNNLYLEQILNENLINLLKETYSTEEEHCIPQWVLTNINVAPSDRILKKNDPAAHGVDILSCKKELQDWLENIKIVDKYQ